MRETLALAFQEVLTAVVRLRSGRQPVTDADIFRTQMKELLRTAAQQARDGGYSPADIRSASFAVIGFLDECVLNSRLPAFADWPRKPMQEELFGTHVAGEVFFRNLQELLARADAGDTADVLEVYELCMLLGFRGRYGTSGQAELQAVLAAAREKIRRIRSAALSAGAGVPATETPRRVSDRWSRALAVAAVACGLAAVGSFVAFKLLLGGMPPN